MKSEASVPLSFTVEKLFYYGTSIYDLGSLAPVTKEFGACKRYILATISAFYQKVYNDFTSY